MTQDLKVFPDLQSLSRQTAQMVVEIAGRSINLNGSFTVALAGGSTPKSLYHLLAGQDFRKKIDWNKVFFFFGDERLVPPDSEDSNYRTASETLFKPLNIDGENIFRWRTETGTAESVAEHYQNTLKSFFNIKADPAYLRSDLSFPRFDLVLLGMGEDGHTASLFPFTTVLDEDKISAASVYVEKLQTMRLTLTFPVLNNAANLIFLVSGENKAATLKEVLDGVYNPKKLPAQKVKLKNGKLCWMVDEKSAKFL